MSFEIESEAFQNRCCITGYATRKELCCIKSTTIALTNSVALSNDVFLRDQSKGDRKAKFMAWAPILETALNNYSVVPLSVVLSIETDFDNVNVIVEIASCVSNIKASEHWYRTNWCADVVLLFALSISAPDVRCLMVCCRRGEISRSDGVKVIIITTLVPVVEVHARSVRLHGDSPEMFLPAAFVVKIELLDSFVSIVDAGLLVRETSLIPIVPSVITIVQSAN